MTEGDTFRAFRLLILEVEKLLIFIFNKAWREILMNTFLTHTFLLRTFRQDREISFRVFDEMTAQSLARFCVATCR